MAKYRSLSQFIVFCMAGFTMLLLMSCMAKRPVIDENRKVAPIKKVPLSQFSLNELLNIPLNEDYTKQTIHQTRSNPIDDNSINFGILAPLSKFPVYSAEIIAAADLAAEYVNKHNGINGRRLVILRADDKENTPVSAMLAAQMVNDYRVEAIIGPATSDSVADVLQQVTIPNQIPLISQAASSMRLNEIGGDFEFWRMVANNQQQIQLISEYLHKQLKHKRVYLIRGRDLYSREIASGLTDYFQQVEAGWTGQLAISDMVYLAQMKLKGDIEALQKKGVTAIVISLVNEQVKEMIAKIREHWQGQYPIIMVTDTVTPKYLIESQLGDIGACIFSYVGTSKDLEPVFSESIAKAITTEATGFHGAYVFDATIILSMAKVLSERFNLPIKQAVELIASDGNSIKFTDFAKLPDLYQQHKRFSFYGYSGRVQFNDKGDNLTAFSRIYSIANQAEKTKEHCITLD